jgi:hypothetical protein
MSLTLAFIIGIVIGGFYLVDKHSNPDKYRIVKTEVIGANSKNSISVGRGVVGGVLFGPVGAAVGGLSGH